MPCRIPDQSNPHQCKKKVKRGTNRPDGLDHVWPEEGHLIISRCEVYCQYCWESKGRTHRFKFPWYLRRHVIDVHEGRTHPNMTCSNGWAESETGNRKPWVEEGVAAPMGRRATPKAPQAKKPPKTPQRQQKRSLQKMKRAAARATPSNAYTRDSTLTLSPPTLTDDDDAFSTPGGQLSLSDTFSGDATNTYNFDNNNGMALTYGMDMFGNNKGTHFASDNDMTTLFGPILTTSLNSEFNSMFSGVDAGDNYGGDYNMQPQGAMTMGLDNTMVALDSASSVMPANNNLISFETPSQGSELIEPNWFSEQVCRTDGATIEPDPTTPVGDGAEKLVYALNDTMFDRLAREELSAGQALHVLQNYAQRFAKGEK